MNKFRILEVLFETPGPNGERYFVRSTEDYCKIVRYWYGSSEIVTVDKLVEMEGGYNDPINEIPNRLMLKWVNYPIDIQWSLELWFIVGTTYENQEIDYYKWMNWERARLISSLCFRFYLNIHPKVILDWNEETYIEFRYWIDKQHSTRLLNDENGTNNKTEPPPEFLQEYIVDEDFPYREYFCHTVRCADPHEGEYSKGELDEKGDTTYIFIDEVWTGILSHEGGYFIGGKNEMKVLVDNGMSPELAIALIEMFLDNDENAAVMGKMFEEVFHNKDKEITN